MSAVDWSSYQMGAVIQGDGIVSNLDYHASGNYLVMSTSESAIHLIDTVSGAEKKKVYAKNCGIGQLKYTHHETCILMSMKNNHDIGYLCLHDNRYIRHFKTHTAEVTSLSMNPANDQFISASNDRSVCLWDLSSPNPTARIQLPQHYDQPSCAFDSAGLVFGILAQDSRRGTPSLKLFDSRNYQGGPFANIFPSSALIERSLANKSFNVSQVHKMLQSNWTDFEFSGDGGQSVLVNNNSEALLILDGYSSEKEPKVIMRKNDAAVQLAATFSACSRYILTSNDENDVLVYDRDSTELLQVLKGHVSPVGRIRCNKVYDSFASGCVNTALWQPHSGSDVSARL